VSEHSVDVTAAEGRTGSPFVRLFEGRRTLCCFKVEALNFTIASTNQRPEPLALLRAGRYISKPAVGTVSTPASALPRKVEWC
jgi:hypothetical protein